MDKKYFIILVVGLYSASVFSAHEGEGFNSFFLDDDFLDAVDRDVNSGGKIDIAHTRHRDSVDTQQQTIGHAIARTVSRTDQSGSSVPVRPSSVAVDSFGDAPIRSRAAKKKSQSIISSLSDARTIDEMTQDNGDNHYFGQTNVVAVNEKGVTTFPRELTYAEVRLKERLKDQRKSLATAIANLKGEAFNEDGSLRPGKALLVKKIIKLQDKDLALLKQIFELNGTASLPPLRFAQDATTAVGLIQQIEALERNNQIDEAALVGQDRLRDDAKLSFKQWIAQRKAKIQQLQAKLIALQ